MAKWVIKRRPDGLVAVKHIIETSDTPEGRTIFDCGAQDSAEPGDAANWAFEEAWPLDIVLMNGEFMGMKLMAVKDIQ